ncbi:MAG: iron ABC transporter substrate-binding protein [Methanolinea sp.]|jgi:iron complex transport system substrate-binding protein
MKSSLPIFLVIAGIVTAGLLCAGCSTQSLAGAVPVAKETHTVVDMMNRTVTLSEDPGRIIGLGAGALRMIVYLQAADRVVGVDLREQDAANGSVVGMPSGIDRPYNIAHPELAGRPFVGAIAGDPELIAVQNPDVVFVTFVTGKDADALQEKSGVPVVSLVSGDLGKNRQAFYGSLRTMAKTLNREQRADEVIAYINATLADLHARTKDIPAGEKPSVYVGGIAFNGAHGFLSTEPSYTPLAMVNGDNVAAGAGSGGQIMIDKEKLLSWNPDVIFVDEASLFLVREDLKDPVYQSLDAIREGRVFGVMPYNWYANNYDTVLADAYYVGKILYPEQFADIDPAQKADEIYTMLDGKPVYADMKEIFGGFAPVDEITV